MNRQLPARSFDLRAVRPRESRVTAGRSSGLPPPRSRLRDLSNLDRAATGDPETFARYCAALANPRNRQRGEKLFREKCGVCHRAHSIGVAVGPDLNAAFQRAEENIVRDILAPSNSMTAGFNLFSVATTEGVFSGLLSAESADSLTFIQAEGKTQTFLRKDIDELKASSLSLMPDDFTKTLTPQDVADILAWLRSPPADRVVLIDEDPAIVELLRAGTGTARFVDTDAQRGKFSLEITPPQRFSGKIPGWQYTNSRKAWPRRVSLFAIRLESDRCGRSDD